MTKLVKKSIDIEKVLEKPHQSCWERLMTWGLSKPAIATIFVAITGWFGKANAFEEGLWGIAFAPVNESFQNNRKFIFITGFFLMLICAVLALFKKVSWFFLWCILSWLVCFAIAGLIVDLTYNLEGPTLVYPGLVAYDDQTIDYVTAFLEFFDTMGLGLFGSLVFFVISLILILLPCLISVIQYKRKKIEKKLLKKRLFIWLIGPVVILSAIFLTL